MTVIQYGVAFVFPSTGRVQGWVAKDGMDAIFPTREDAEKFAEDEVIQKRGYSANMVAVLPYGSTDC